MLIQGTMFIIFEKCSRGYNYSRVQSKYLSYLLPKKLSTGFELECEIQILKRLVGMYVCTKFMYSLDKYLLTEMLTKIFVVVLQLSIFVCGLYLDLIECVHSTEKPLFWFLDFKVQSILESNLLLDTKMRLDQREYNMYKCKL